jgi:uncharacterized protein YjiS (DUF1127 family)
MLTFLMSAPVALLAPSSRPGAIPRLVGDAARSVAAWNERRRQLRALSELDDDLLQDIGLSRDDVEHACSRPFWGLKSLLPQPPTAP